MIFCSRNMLSMAVFFGIAVLLASCNKENPYGSDIAGPGDYINATNPLDPSSPATQIALFADKPIENLAYQCNDSNVTTSRMTFLSDLSGADDSDSGGLASQVPVARCGNEASSVSFYLGKPGGSYNSPKRNAIYLGTAYLPPSLIGSDGKLRFGLKADGTGYEASQSSFLLNFSMADLQTGPARVDVDGAFNANSECKNDRSDACQIIAKTALVLALDENANDPTLKTIKVDQDANERVAASTLDPELVAEQFKQTDYSMIAGGGPTGWGTFIAAVNANYAMDTANNVSKRILAGASRLRAGTYSFDYAAQLALYAMYFPNSLKLPELATSSMKLSSSLVVYPDGTMLGFGMANDDMSNNCTSVDGLLECLLDVFMDKVSLDNFVVLTSEGNSVPELSNSLVLRNANFRPVSISFNQVELQVFGRFLAGILYDGREPDANVDERTDVKTDYPSTSFVLKDSEKGSIVGRFYDRTFPDYDNGRVLNKDMGGGVFEPTPFPIRIEKEAGVQVAPLNETVLQILEGENYRLRLMRVCLNEDDENDCAPIPNYEKEVGANGNYSEGGCFRPNESDDEVCDFELNPENDGEIATLVNENDASKGNFVDVRFVRDSTNGLVMQLLDNSCVLRNDSFGKPMNVGYVVATPEDENNNHKSAVVSMLFSTVDRNQAEAFPQLGVELGGRIDIDEASWPMYRSADGGFNDQVRARWFDTSSYQSIRYLKALNKTNADSLTDYEIARFFLTQSGAVNGQKLDASCNIIP